MERYKILLYYFLHIIASLGWIPNRTREEMRIKRWLLTKADLWSLVPTPRPTEIIWSDLMYHFKKRMLVMKNIYIKIVSGVIMATLTLGGCSKILEEEPRSVFTPEFFKTEKGILGGITALYGHLRNIYGNGYYYNATLTG